jgi:hypothetical protein
MRTGWPHSIVAAVLGAALAAGCAVETATPAPVAPVAPASAPPGRSTAPLATIPAYELEPTPYAGGSGSYQLEIVIRDYAKAHPGEFGGTWVATPGTTVVSLWTANLDVHEAALRALLPPGADFAVRQVRHTERELEALSERVSATWGWFARVDAKAIGLGVDGRSSIVELEISSANPDAPRRILEHYGVTADILAITSDGTGIALLPQSWVEGVVVTAEGEPPGVQDLDVEGRIEGVGRCGGGDIGYGVAPDGGFRIPCTPGDWTILVRADDGLGHSWVVGRGEVTVEAGRMATVRIVLYPAADLGG